MGTIEKRGKNSWRIGERLPTADGRRWIRRTLTYPDSMTETEQRRAAELELARLMVAIADGLGVPAQDMTVRELADTWLTQHVDVECKPTTAATYRALMSGRILPALGDKKISLLKPMDIQRFLNELRSSPKRTTRVPAAERKRSTDRRREDAPPKPLSDRTVRHCYDVLNYMFNQAVKWQLISQNPLAHVDRPRVRRRRMRFLDDDQAVDLLRKLAGEELSFRCAVLLALLCGLRLGEVGGLYLDDVDWQRGTIRITQALHYTADRGDYIDSPKSVAGERVIALPAGMMTLLNEMRLYQHEVSTLLGDRWRGDGRIVSAWDGRPLHHDTPSKQFRKFADRNGFAGVRFQDLRHAHASILFANNVDAVAVAARLGHESPDTTFRYYAHAIARRDQESADAMQRIMDRSEVPAPHRPAIEYHPARGETELPPEILALGDAVTIVPPDAPAAAASPAPSEAPAHPRGERSAAAAPAPDDAPPRSPP